MDSRSLWRIRIMSPYSCVSKSGLSHGLSFTGNYTFSKFMDYSDAGGNAWIGNIGFAGSPQDSDQSPSGKERERERYAAPVDFRR